MIQINPSAPEIARLQRGIQYYWCVPQNFIDPNVIIQPQAFQTVAEKIGFVKKFVGPKFKDKETVSFSFSTQNQLMIGSLPW